MYHITVTTPRLSCFIPPLYHLSSSPTARPSPGMFDSASPHTTPHLLVHGCSGREVQLGRAVHGRTVLSSHSHPIPSIHPGEQQEAGTCGKGTGGVPVCGREELMPVLSLTATVCLYVTATVVLYCHSYCPATVWLPVVYGYGYGYAMLSATIITLLGHSPFPVSGWLPQQHTSPIPPITAPQCTCLG